MDLRHPCQKFDLKEYRRNIISALVEENTIVYLDTSILSMLYKLSKGARADFYKWVKANEKKVKIPNWVMNEYLKRAVNNNLNEYYPVSVAEIFKKIKNQRGYFSGLLDEDKARNAGFSGISEIMCEFDRAYDFFMKLHKHFGSNVEIDTIRDEVNLYFSNSILEQKISITSDLISEFNIRLENKMPPGFDENKKMNIIGDFIIWKEILTNVKNEKTKKIIFLTNDEKKDWVYTPQKIIIDGQLISNQSPKKHDDILLPVKLPDPRLVNEYYFTTGTGDFYICNFYFFCNVLSTQDPGIYSNLDLINQPIENEKTIPPSDDVFVVNDDEEKEIYHCSQQQQPQDQNNDQFASLEVSESAIKDILKYQSSIPDVNEILEGFKTCNWYRQSRALTKLFAVDKSLLSSDDLFLIGRNLYQTACGYERETIRLLNSSKQFADLFPTEKIEKVILGMLFEVYFDKEGIQRDVKKTGKIQTLFEYRNMYSEAFRKIGDILKKGDKKLFYYPGDTENIKIDVNGTLKQPEGYIVEVFFINAIKINGENIFAQADGDSYLWKHPSYYDLFKSFSSTKEMKAVIADIFALPLTLIALNIPDYKNGILQIEKRLKISEFD